MEPNGRRARTQWPVDSMRLETRRRNCETDYISIDKSSITRSLSIITMMHCLKCGSTVCKFVYYRPNTAPKAKDISRCRMC